MIMFFIKMGHKLFSANLLFLILLTVIFIFGCRENIYTSEDDSKDEKNIIERNDNLFVTETANDGTEQIVFRTYNKEHWNYEGMTIWTVRNGLEDDFTTRTVKMSKPNGFSGAGYGIIFCHSEHMINSRIESVMLVVMINNDGDYIVGKAVGGIFYDYGWWKQSQHLRRGPGVTNEITIRYEEETNEYCIVINGVDVENFVDSEEPRLRRGKNGYIVVITPYDSFPDPGIDVYFEEG